MKKNILITLFYKTLAAVELSPPYIKFTICLREKVANEKLAN